MSGNPNRFGEVESQEADADFTVTEFARFLAISLGILQRASPRLGGQKKGRFQ